MAHPQRLSSVDLLTRALVSLNSSAYDALHRQQNHRVSVNHSFCIDELNRHCERFVNELENPSLLLPILYGDSEVYAHDPPNQTRDGQPPCPLGLLGNSLRYLSVLGGSALKVFCGQLKRRDAEHGEVAQRVSSCYLHVFRHAELLFGD